MSKIFIIFANDSNPQGAHSLNINASGGRGVN
jgi:hypothetical protein